MYAPPDDRTSPLLAQLARLQAAHRAPERTPFSLELATVRNEVAHYTLPSRPGASLGGLQRRSRLQESGGR